MFSLFKAKNIFAIKSQFVRHNRVGSENRVFSVEKALVKPAEYDSVFFQNTIEQFKRKQIFGDYSDAFNHANVCAFKMRLNRFAGNYVYRFRFFLRVGTGLTVKATLISLPLLMPPTTPPQRFVA